VKWVPYCSKCGNEVAEEVKYCPKCGAYVKAGAVHREVREKQEKQEKHEKHEKQEKQEKHEKGERGLFWTLLGGLILLIFGVVSIISEFLHQDFWPFFLMIAGVLIVIFAIYGAIRASQRTPRP
jgi:uncharacterized membrane protein YvbJ